MMKKIYENHCWQCKSYISSNYNNRCTICGWYICGTCEACSEGCSKGEERLRENSEKKAREFEALLRKRKAEEERIKKEKKKIIIDSLERFVLAVFLLYELQKMKIGEFFFGIQKSQIREFKKIYSSVQEYSVKKFIVWLEKYYYKKKMIEDSDIEILWEKLEEGFSFDFYDFLEGIGMLETSGYSEVGTIKFVQVCGSDKKRRKLYLNIIEEIGNQDYIRLMYDFESFIFKKKYSKRENQSIDYVNGDLTHRISYRNDVYAYNMGIALVADFKYREGHFQNACSVEEYPKEENVLYFSTGMYKAVCKNNFKDENGYYWFSRYTKQEYKAKKLKEWNEKNANDLDKYLPTRPLGKQWKHCIVLETEEALVPFNLKGLYDEQCILEELGYYVKDTDNGYIIRPTTHGGREKYVSGQGYVHSGELEYQRFLKIASKYIEKCKKKGKFPNKEFMEYIFGVKINDKA